MCTSEEINEYKYMDKKYIVGLVFAVLLLGSASAVAVRVVLHGKSSVPVKGLTSSASGPAANPPATEVKKSQPAEDFVLPVEKAVTLVNMSDVPTSIKTLLGDTKDARAFSVEYANGSKGYRVEQDMQQSLTKLSGQWQTTFQTAGLSAHSKVSADQALYQTQSGEYTVVIVLSRLTDTTTGQTVSAVR